MKVRFKQLTPRGWWTSPEVFDIDDATVRRYVLDGHILGQPRAAVRADQGTVIFAIDAFGRETPEAASLFENGCHAELPKH